MLAVVAGGHALGPMEKKIRKEQVQSKNHEGEEPKQGRKDSVCLVVKEPSKPVLKRAEKTDQGITPVVSLLRSPTLVH